MDRGSTKSAMVIPSGPLQHEISTGTLHKRILGFSSIQNRPLLIGVPCVLPMRYYMPAQAVFRHIRHSMRMLVGVPCAPG